MSASDQVPFSCFMMSIHFDCRSGQYSVCGRRGKASGCSFPCACFLEPDIFCKEHVWSCASHLHEIWNSHHCCRGTDNNYFVVLHFQELANENHGNAAGQVIPFFHIELLFRTLAHTILLQILFWQKNSYFKNRCCFQLYWISGNALIDIVCYYCNQPMFNLQLWGSLGSVVILMVLFIHPVFFSLGILGQFPFIVTDLLWPRARYAILGLASAKLLTTVARPLSKSILVLFEVLQLDEWHAAWSTFCPDEGRSDTASAFVLRIRCELLWFCLV